MGRYSLGKNVGTTDKKSSRKHTPTGDTLGAVTISPVQEIKEPQLVPQKWQGNTFISNPGPTLVPQLKLPSVANVLAEPNRDFEQLAKALSVFDDSAQKAVKDKISLGAAQRKYWDGEAERVISQAPESANGTTSVDRLASLQSSLNKIASLKPYTQEDVDAGRIKPEQIGQYPNGETAESIEAANDQLNYIKTNSRLQEAIQSKYKERDVINRAASLSSAQKTESITETKEIVENGVTKTIEVKIPIHTLSPNDPRYISWVESFLKRDGIILNAFEYNNVKGKIIQFRTNALTSQASNFSTHLDNEMEINIIETTTDIGTRLAKGEIDRKTATHELQELLEKMNIFGTSAENKKKFNEELAINTIAAFTKAAELSNADPAIVLEALKFLSVGAKESRVNGKGHFNEKQAWTTEFPTGWLSERYNDALTRVKGHDEKAQKNLNSKYLGTATAHYEKEIRPTLFENGDLAPENMNSAIQKVRDWQAKAIKDATNYEQEVAINKAATALENNIYGVFSGDYKTDAAMLNRLSLEAMIDPKKAGRFDFYLSEFTSRWSGYSKADDLANKLQSRMANLKGKSREKVLGTFTEVINDIEKWYVEKYGVLPTSEGGTSKIEEQANWEIMKINLLNQIYDELGPSPTEAELANKLKEIKEKFTGPLGLGTGGTSAADLKVKLPFLENLLNGRKQDFTPRYEDGPLYKGNSEKALSTFNSVYDPEGTGNTKLDIDTRKNIKDVFESEQPFFDANTLEALVDTMFKDGTKEINFDPRLKVLINNLPGQYKGKVGQFLLLEFKKHGIELDEEYKTLITGLDNVEISSLLLSGSYAV